MPKLTKLIVEKAKPDTKRDQFIWDTALPGFGVRIYPSGTRKYVAQYRMPDRRQRRMVIGKHGVLTTEQARAIAQEKLYAATKGEDPAADKRNARQAPTVRALAQDYLERHAIPNKRPASVDDDRSMLNRLILPALGTVKVAAVGRRDIETLFNGLRSKPYAANRLLALLSKMFSLAVDWDWCVKNPARGIKRFHEDRRERWLSEGELQRLWTVLDRHQNKRSANAVKLLILTGSRRNEVLGATWDQFDLDRGVWTKPSHHTKQKRTEYVPLSGEALDLLTAMLKTADPKCLFLFPGGAPGKPLGDIKKFWRSACKEADLEGVRLHDLRHTYASNLVSNGVSLHMVGRLLGHTQPQTTARYAHLDDEALRAATEVVGGGVRKASQRQESD